MQRGKSEREQPRQQLRFGQGDQGLVGIVCTRKLHPSRLPPGPHVARCRLATYSLPTSSKPRPPCLPPLQLAACTSSCRGTTPVTSHSPDPHPALSHALSRQSSLVGKRPGGSTLRHDKLGPTDRHGLTTVAAKPAPLHFSMLVPACTTDSWCCWEPRANRRRLHLQKQRVAKLGKGSLHFAAVCLLSREAKGL